MVHIACIYHVMSYVLYHNLLCEIQGVRRGLILDLILRQNFSKLTRDNPIIFCTKHKHFG